MSDAKTGAKPLTSEEEMALRAAWALIGAWEKREDGVYPCPLCDEQGTVDGFVLDATNITPATLGGYGIGEGLMAATLVAESTGPLLASLDAERARADAAERALRYNQLSCREAAEYLRRAENPHTNREATISLLEKTANGESAEATESYVKDLEADCERFEAELLVKDGYLSPVEVERRVAEEREACAKVVEESAPEMNVTRALCRQVADRVRARGAKAGPK